MQRGYDYGYQRHSARRNTPPPPPLTPDSIPRLPSGWEPVPGFQSMPLFRARSSFGTLGPSTTRNANASNFGRRRSKGPFLFGLNVVFEESGFLPDGCRLNALHLHSGR
jgi:hypothetical protein